MKNEVNRAPWAKKKTFLFILALCAASVAWGATTVTKTAKQIADANGWTKVSTAYTSAKLDDNITITVTPGTEDKKNGVYYTGDYTDTYDWRMYQARANGQFTISAADGYLITSVKLTYEITNSGVVSISKKQNSVATPETDRIISGTSCPFAAQDLTFYVGNTTATTTNGQARIRSFSVTYEKGIYDDFRDPATGKQFSYSSATEKSVITQCFAWTVHQCRFNVSNDMDKLADGTLSHTMWKSSGSYLKTEAVEGGVKFVSFPWNQANADESSKGTETVKVTVDTKTQSQSRDGKKGENRGADSIFAYACNVAKNADVKIEITAGNRITVGPITFVPYLRYTQKSDELIILASEAEATYKNEAFINNTGATPTFSIISSEPASIATIAEDGTVTATASGTITVQAKWENVTTTYTLNITKNSLPVPQVSFEYDPVEKTMNDVPFVNAITAPTEGLGAITYSSTDPTVAEVATDGTVTIIGAGETKIQLAIAASETWAATDAEYTLTITDPQEEAIIETFPRSSSGSNTENKIGKYYEWTVTGGARTRTTDTLYIKGDNEEKYSIWLSGNDAASISTTIEGGVKRVGFLWNKFNKDASSVTISVKAGDVERKLTKEVQTGVNQNNPDLEFNSNFGVKSSNTTLTISKEKLDASTALQVGPIKITPYLLYTKKTLTVKLADVKSVGITNEKLIDNTEEEGTIVYSVPEDNGVATIESATGKLTISAAGEVIVTAAWDPEGGDNYTVTTTYKLIVNDRSHREAKFASPQVTMKQGEDLPGNELTYAKASGESITINYASSDNTVAEIINNAVVVTGVGMTTITATIEQTDDFYEDKASYLLIVYPKEDAKHVLVEDYKTATGGLASTGTQYQGNFATWTYRNSRSKDTDILKEGTKGFMFSHTNGENKASSYFEATLDGGIKAVYFDWKQFTKDDNGQNLIFQIKINNSVKKSIEDVAKDELVDNIQSFCYAPEVKSNDVKLTFANNAKAADGKTDVQGRIMMGPLTIVPYLFYKTKYHKIDVVGGDEPTWTNPDLINNTEDGNIEYTIEDVEGEGVADIDATNGQVTAKSNGKAKVTATWTPTGALEGEVVTTTYEVEVFYSKLDAELAFDPEEITVGEDAIAVSPPTLSNPHELTIKYSSSDEEIATVDEAKGFVTLKQVAGDVIISATSEETDTYKEGSASYTIHVLPLPDVSFPNLTGNKKTVDMDQVPFTETILIKVNEEDVTSSAEITYTSDNEEVAVIKDGEVNIIGEGTTTITAKIAQTEIYAGRDVYYTLTVKDNTPAEKQWTETFSSIGNVNDYITSRKADIVGDSSIYSWAMRNYRRRQTQADSLATERAIRLSNAKNNYIETLNNQEGGIKRISFNWRTPGNEAGQLPINLNVSVCYNNNYQDTVKRPMTRAKSKDNMTDNSYCSNFFVKQNAKLKIDIADETYSVMLIGPITIVPYLLYTEKEVSVKMLNRDTYINESLINNTDGGTIVYSLEDNDGVAEIDPESGVVNLLKGGEVTVKASWTPEGESAATVTTSYKLKIKGYIYLDENPDEPIDLTPHAGQTIDVTLVRSDLVANMWNSLCLPFAIDKADLGDATVAQIGKTELVEDVLNIWIAEIADTELAAGVPYLVFPTEGVNLSGDYEDVVVTSVAGAQGVGMVTLQGIFSPFAMNAGDESKLFLAAPDEEGHNLFYASKDGKLKGMRAYFSIQNTPSGAPVRVGRIGIQQTPTELGGEADRLNGRQAMKVLRDGQFYIIRETKTYNAQGIEIQ